MEHALLDRLLRKCGATHAAAPTLEAWQRLLALVAQTYQAADQDRYTLERAMDLSSREMRALHDELQLRSAREIARHRLLFEGNPLPMWMLDSETLRIVDANAAMTTVYGYSRGELLAMRQTDLKLPDEVPAMVAEMTAVPPDGVHHVGVRRHRTKDGGVIHVDLSSHKMVVDGRTSMLVIAMDRTRALRVEEELRQAQKMDAIGRLAGGIAHDFNNLLGVILGNSELALDELCDGHPAAEDLAEIRAAATRAAGLTRQLLQFSRKQARQPKPLALNAVVTGIEAMLARIVGEDVAMSAVIAPGLGTIAADPGEVEQVVMNLVVNARDAMPAGGELVLRTSNATVDAARAAELGVAAGAYVVLAVADTGCGMTAEVRARIFEPFFTTKDVDKGTGLGLATVFGIVKESGGAIAVDSEPGRGSTFQVFWPRVDLAAVPIVEQRRMPVHGSGTVLVVEDDRQLRALIERYLTGWGYTLLAAPSGVAALELVSRHDGPIDLVLTDLVMPGGVDGRTLGRQVLAARPHARVIYMSGYTEHATLHAATFGPDDDFLHKPFTAHALSEALQRALARVAVMARRVAAECYNAAMLTGKQRRHLRALGHARQPIVQVGKGGLDDSVVAAVDRALADHELVKVRIGNGAEVDRHAAASELAGRTNSEVAQVLGNVVLLFRARAEDSKIELPRGR